MKDAGKGAGRHLESKKRMITVRPRANHHGLVPSLRRMSRPVLLAAVLALWLPSMAGCRSGPSEVAGGAAAEPVGGALDVGGTTEDAVGRLTGSNNGLELIKWLIDDQPSRIAEAMSRYTEPAMEGSPTDRALRRNGLRLVRIPLDSLDQLREELGGTKLETRGWHGQILEWRPLYALPLGRNPVTIAVDGHVRTYRGGELALLGRSWTVTMEDGPYLQLELVPAYLQTPPPRDYLQLLGTDRPQATEGFISMAVDLQLDPGFAYILTWEEPDTIWTAAGGRSSSSEEEVDASTDSSLRPGGIGVGPEFEAPPMLGQLLFSAESGRSGRGLLIFVPRVPAALFPPA